MIYPILLYDNNILRKTSNSVNLDKANKKEMKEFINDMFETMHKAKGIGLSAIQIDRNIRMFVIEAHMKEDELDIRETFINPVITKKYGQNVKMTEGCLSMPGLTALVDRPDKIDIEYYNADFKLIKKTFTGYSSRIIQHEMDHLDGKLFIDRLDLLWQGLLSDTLNDIKNKKLSPNYLSR